MEMEVRGTGRNFAAPSTVCVERASRGPVAKRGLRSEAPELSGRGESKIEDLRSLYPRRNLYPPGNRAGREEPYNHLLPPRPHRGSGRPKLGRFDFNFPDTAGWQFHGDRRFFWQFNRDRIGRQFRGRTSDEEPLDETGFRFTVAFNDEVDLDRKTSRRSGPLRTGDTAGAQRDQQNQGEDEGAVPIQDHQRSQRTGQLTEQGSVRSQ